jgi:hypothetical protein
VAQRGGVGGGGAGEDVAACNAVWDGVEGMWGQNLAQVMLKVVVAAVARNFDVMAPSEMDERTMENSFVSWGCCSFYVSIFTCLRFPCVCAFLV